MFFRFVTLKEANAFLPLVKERFAKIHDLVAEGQALHDSLPASEDFDLLTSSKGEATTSKRTAVEEAKTRKRVTEIEHEIKKEVVRLNQLGAIVKSVFPPRADFLAKRNDQPVYLTWQVGDKKISSWRPMDDEFALRRRIQNPQNFGPFFLQ